MEKEQQSISKFLSTPICREGATMFTYLDEEMNIIRLNDLWECNIIKEIDYKKIYLEKS